MRRSRARVPSSPADAFRTTLDLFETGVDLMRQNLRRGHPAADDEQIDRLLDAWPLERPEPNLVTLPAAVLIEPQDLRPVSGTQP